MDSHLLPELIYVLYGIRSTIIHGKRWLMETSGKFCLFFSPCKWWFRNLDQGPLHNISSYSLAKRAPTFPFVKMLFLTRERLAWWSSRPLSVDSIFFVIKRTLELERYRFCCARQSCLFKSSISCCMAFSSPCPWAAWPFLRYPLPPVWTVCRLPSW